MKRGGGIADVFNNALASIQNKINPGQNTNEPSKEPPKEEEGSFIGSVYKSFTSEKLNGLQATVAEGEKQLKKLKKKKDELNAQLDADIKKCTDSQENLKREIDKTNSDSDKINNMIAAGKQTESQQSYSETPSETPSETQELDAPEAAAQAEEYRKAREAMNNAANNPGQDNALNNPGQDNAFDNAGQDNALNNPVQEPVSSDSTLTAGEIKRQLPGLDDTQKGGTRRKKRKRRTKRRRHRAYSRKKRKSRARGSSRRKRGF